MLSTLAVFITASQTEVDGFKEAITLVKGAKTSTAFSYAISQHKNYQREA